jgi:hypothetical protein
MSMEEEEETREEALWWRAHGIRNRSIDGKLDLVQKAREIRQQKTCMIASVLVRSVLILQTQ